jgi:rhodanese-related sulfurtransferase
MTRTKNKTKSKAKNKAKTKTWIVWLLVIVGIVVVVLIDTLIMKFMSAPQDSMPNSVSAQNAAVQFADGALLLDVREQYEWDETHVEGALLIPLLELPNRIDELPTDQDILVICRTGNRSAQARDLLREAGLERTTSISGGIDAWISAGLPVVSGP